MSANATANAGNNMQVNTYINTKPLILIPAYNPSKILLEIVDTLHDVGFADILVVNDGSDKHCQEIFDLLSDKPYCTIETHAHNMGKGAALKTGLKRFLTGFTDYDFVITANADGQHSLEAITTVAATLEDNPDCLVLGVGDYEEFDEIPLGNKLFKAALQKILSFFLSQDIVDIQTGLRGISRALAARFQVLAGDKYDYESNMIFECQGEEIPIKQVPIKVSFIKKRDDGNEHPVLDAIKLYGQFIKFIIVSLSTTALDVFAFMMFVYAFRDASPVHFILLATVASRLISLLFAYIINNLTVFKSRVSNKKSFGKFFVLAILNIFLSAYAVKTIYMLTAETMNLAVIKILVSLGLFFLNYTLQKKWVFKSKTILK
ncbi:MAG: glycosyltransferase [Bacillota bacterium]|jgi:putative flippase GtrA